MSRSRSFRAVRALVLVLLLAVGAAPLLPAGGTQGLDTSILRAKYLRAVEDARVAKVSEISNDLVAIVKGPQDAKLRWEGEPGNSRVLVISWVEGAWYDGYVGRDYVLPRFVNLWVTVVPELQDFISSSELAIAPAPPSLGTLTGNMNPDVTPLRIEQLLGLPPNAGMTRFVEMWVNPRDMFRPSPDPEITDHEAELQFSTKTSRFLAFNTSPTILDNGTEYTYPAWFNQRLKTVYSGGRPYPWTRLGYTYDWADEAYWPGDRQPRVGLSEFVILGGSAVGVKAVRLTGQYIKEHEWKFLR